MIDNRIPIDAVITWVDGNDEQHQKKRLKVLEEETGAIRNELKTGRDPTRFMDNGELYFCIQSIRTFLPWIRTIHLVTDNQRPGFLTPELQKNYNIRIVDHKKVLASYEWALPVFNSRTIETALWRIPGLAPHFIYFNDYFVITRELSPDDFFIGEKVVLLGEWSTITRYGAVRMKCNNWATLLAKNLLGITRSMHLLLQIRSARLAGFTGQYFRVPHIPHPIRTETLRSWFDKHPNLFKKNIAYKFRNVDQFSAINLAHHIEIKEQRAVLKAVDEFVMINGEMDFGFTLKIKLSKIENSGTKFVCLHGLEKFKDSHLNRIKVTLNKQIKGIHDHV